jgi:hypothetical protein
MPPSLGMTFAAHQKQIERIATSEIDTVAGAEMNLRIII